MIPHTSNGIWTLAQVDIQSMYEEIRRGGIMNYSHSIVEGGLPEIS